MELPEGVAPTDLEHAMIPAGWGWWTPVYLFEESPVKPWRVPVPQPMRDDPSMEQVQRWTWDLDMSELTY